MDSGEKAGKSGLWQREKERCAKAKKKQLPSSVVPIKPRANILAMHRHTDKQTKQRTSTHHTESANISRQHWFLCMLTHVLVLNVMLVENLRQHFHAITKPLSSNSISLPLNHFFLLLLTPELLFFSFFVYLRLSNPFS